MLYLTRHGETNWNVQRKVMGKVDEPLNDNGRKQAKMVKEKLANIYFDLIICSPLLRARETASVINEDKQCMIIYDDRISERDYGEFEGMETKNFDFFGYWDYHKNMKYEKAENIQVFFKRIYDFLDDITDTYRDKNILIVTHGGVSIPIGCYFQGNIPEGPLVETDLVLGNCQVVSYDMK